ncbi:hypothetical protein AB7M15_004215 [Bradyrhizobium ottawaense]
MTRRICFHVNLSSQQSAGAAFSCARWRERPSGLSRTRRSGEHSQGRIQGALRPRQSTPCRNRRRRGGEEPGQLGLRARARGHHRAGARDSRYHRPGRASRIGGRADRLGRARPRTGLSARGCNRGGPQIRHAADRTELPRHHDARGQPECQLCRAHAGGGQPRADLAIGRDCCRHGRLGCTARRRLFRHRLHRRSDRRRYRRSARLFRDGSQDSRDPAATSNPSRTRASSCRQRVPPRA